MTAIVLLLLMLLGLFPLTAYAANGPSEENMSYALFYNGEESYPVYREQQAVNDSIGGATYDRGTNTVTITDFNHPELGFATNMMGDDLKLKVVGNCALSTIIIYGWGYGGGLSIIGDGTLTINSSGKKTPPINLFAEDSDAVLTLGKDVTLHLYADGSLASVIFTKHRDKASAIVAENGMTPDVTGEQAHGEETDRVLAVSDNDDHYMTNSYGFKLSRAADPDGIYGAEYDKTDGKYLISRYEYVERFDTLTRDDSFQYDYLTEEELAAKGYSFVRSDQPVKVQCFTEWEYERRGTSVDRVVCKADPENVYCVDYSWSSEFGEDPENYYLHRLFWDSSLESYVEDPDYPYTKLTPEEFFADYTYVNEQVTHNVEFGSWYYFNLPTTEEDNYLNRLPQLTRDYDPETIYVQSGTFSYELEDGYHSGYVFKSVYYDEQTGEYFFDGDCAHGTEYVDVDEKDFDESGFHFLTETTTERTRLYYMSRYYDPETDGSFEPQVVRASDPDGMYVAVPQNEEGGYLVYRLTRNPNGAVWIRENVVEKYYENLAELAEDGYSFIIENQIEKLTASGSIYKGELDVCIDGSGKKHLLLYGDVYDYSEDDTVEIGGDAYYVITRNRDLGFNDVTVPTHEVYYDAYNYTLNGSELHYTPSAQPAFMLGDVNGDEKVDITDATMIQKAVAELIELDENQQLAADVNEDNKVDITDATMIQKYVAEMIDHFGKDQG